MRLIGLYNEALARKPAKCPPQSQGSRYLSDIVLVSTVEALHICGAVGVVLQGRVLLLWRTEAVGVIVRGTTFKEKQRPT